MPPFNKYDFANKRSRKSALSPITQERIYELASKGIIRQEDMGKELGVKAPTVSSYLQKVSFREAYDRGIAEYNAKNEVKIAPRHYKKDREIQNS